MTGSAEMDVQHENYGRVGCCGKADEHRCIDGHGLHALRLHLTNRPNGPQPGHGSTHPCSHHLDLPKRRFSWTAVPA